MTSKRQPPKGTFDLLPSHLCKEPWHDSKIWQEVKKIFSQTAELAGYGQVSTPIFEATDLFIKSTGESSDIVGKEMYSFLDKADRSMTLRPEGTPGTLRALANAQAHQITKENKVYYCGPMFRYERPQKGRYRQFHQFGIEMIGTRSPLVDAEVIQIANHAYSQLGIKKIELQMNTLGNFDERKEYKKALVEHFQSYPSLSEDSQRRLAVNPLRILDSKDSRDADAVSMAPKLHDFLGDLSKSHFDRVCSHLDSCSISFKYNPFMVRGLDYYSDTVFEWVYEDFGAKNSIGGGGRYANLYKEVGGAHLEGVGFACGLERVIQIYLDHQISKEKKERKGAYLISCGSDNDSFCLCLANDLRKRGIQVELQSIESPKKLTKSIHWADQSNYLYTMVIGDDDRKNGSLQIKNLNLHKSYSSKLDLPSILQILQTNTF